MSSPRAAAAFLASIVLAACSGAPPPPPPSASAAVPPPPLRPSLLDEPAAPLRTPPAEPVAPLDRELVAFPLPPKTPEVLGVSGRDERDVWLLVSRGNRDVSLLHWDGARFETVPRPKCELGVEFLAVVALSDAVVLTGNHYVEGGVGSVTARRDVLGDKKKNGGWVCESGNHDQLVPLGAALLRYRNGELTFQGQRQPLIDPHHRSWMALGQYEVAAHAVDDLWLYPPGGGEILHGNGVAWESRPPGVARVHSLRVDRAGVAWMVGGDEKEPEGHLLQRWDRQAHAWTRLPTPPDLRGTRVRARDDGDVWVLGREHVHRWDGRVFHRGPMPLGALRAAWLGPSGELWLAGTAPGRDDAGAVFRLVEKKP